MKEPLHSPLSLEKNKAIKSIFSKMISKKLEKESFSFNNNPPLIFKVHLKIKIDKKNIIIMKDK
jgi:hypothetical protein